MSKHFFFTGIFIISFFSASAVFADEDCTAHLNINEDTDEWTIDVPCVQLIEDLNSGTNFSATMKGTQRGNSMNWDWDVVVVNPYTAEETVSCTGIVDLNHDHKGMLILPCVEYEDKNYAVRMTQNGSSMNWAMSLISLIVPKTETDSSSAVCKSASKNANNCKTKTNIFDADEQVIEEPADIEDDSPGKSEAAKDKAPGKNK